MTLERKVALVTGSGRGIGRAVAIVFARAGAEVAVADIEVGPAEETSAEIGALGQHRLTVQVDLCDLADINGMVETVASEMSGIDAVGNNGDLGYGQGIEL